MKDRKVLHGAQIPAKFPLILTAVVWLLMDRFQPPGWVHGVVWTVMTITWIACIFAVYTQDCVKLKELE